MTDNTKEISYTYSYPDYDYSQGCSNRLPFGLCKLTGEMCTLANNSKPIVTWTNITWICTSENSSEPVVNWTGLTCNTEEK